MKISELVIKHGLPIKIRHRETPSHRAFVVRTKTEHGWIVDYPDLTHQLMKDVDCDDYVVEGIPFVYVFDILFACPQCHETQTVTGKVADILSEIRESGWPICAECNEDMEESVIF